MQDQERIPPEKAGELQEQSKSQETLKETGTGAPQMFVEEQSEAPNVRFCGA